MAVRRAAGFVIYRNFTGNTEFLLLQASNQNHHWSPPKGHVDPGEDDLTTAFRETWEESGIKQEQLELHSDIKDELHYEAWGKPKVVTYWLARLKDPSTQVKISHEHQDYKWLNITDACKYAEYKDMQNTLNKFNEYLCKK
eukprot:TRINITY_DN14114_c0_g1_i4.p1 TRINITY_DN14114_c0_g1~~TRINITY_DN14114_c0_g1_i4.p1  ORF type:complete len:141 (-),score=18.89 TRINITY_DN14114_c0_g1_i4:9-431(-)